MHNRLEKPNIKVGRVALDADFDMFRLNFAVKQLCANVLREIYVQIDLV